VLLHAITDALLGAAALGDIGELFPDTDPANRNRDSGEMLGAAMSAVRLAGYEVVNVDCTVFAQRPKLLAYKREIKKSIARSLAINENCVGVKAKTGEVVGPVGREEAIEAECVVLISKTNSIP
jgi:2-C-methyl-D-erythritol 2,4-cyclodiphosphate synthase